MKKSIDLKLEYKVLTVKDGILRVSLNPGVLPKNANKKIVNSSKSSRVVVQGEFLEVFSKDAVTSTAKYLAKVFSIKEDVIEAVLLADDRPVKEGFVARFVGTTGKIKVGFEILGHTVDALGVILDEPLAKLKLKQKNLIGNKPKLFLVLKQLIEEQESKKKKQKKFPNC